MAEGGGVQLLGGFARLIVTKYHFSVKDYKSLFPDLYPIPILGNSA
jgi:hypothetical protein